MAPARRDSTFRTLFHKKRETRVDPALNPYDESQRPRLVESNRLQFWFGTVIAPTYEGLAIFMNLAKIKPSIYMFLFALTAVTEKIESAPRAAVVLKRMSTITTCAAGILALSTYLDFKRWSSLPDPSLGYRKVSQERWQGYPKLESGKLTPFWTLEAIGGDLATNYINELKATGMKLFPVSYGIFDTALHRNLLPTNIYHPNFETKKMEISQSYEFEVQNHGTAVANLINGTEFSPTHVGQFRLALESPLGFGKAMHHISVDPSVVSSADLQILNLSVDWVGLNKETAEGILASPNKPLLVLAAGNEMFDGSYLLERFQRIVTRLKGRIRNADQPIPALRVASMDPKGSVSSFSSTGKYISVAAPSGFAILSRDGGNDDYRFEDATGQQKEFSFFSGTSGAAPLVTGAFINVFALVEEISLEEAELLLKQTAIPLLEKRSEVGYGLLNAYRLVRVAEKLRNSNFTNADNSSRMARLKSNDLYNFTSEANQIYEQAQAARALKSEIEYLNLLRKVFFLNHSRKIALEISDFYESNGFTTNGEFYRRIASKLE